MKYARVCRAGVCPGRLEIRRHWSLDMWIAQAAPSAHRACRQRLIAGSLAPARFWHAPTLRRGKSPADTSDDVPEAIWRLSHGAIRRPLPRCEVNRAERADYIPSMRARDHVCMPFDAEYSRCLYTNPSTAVVTKAAAQAEVRFVLLPRDRDVRRQPGCRASVRPQKALH